MLLQKLLFFLARQIWQLLQNRSQVLSAANSLELQLWKGARAGSQGSGNCARPFSMHHLLISTAMSTNTRTVLAAIDGVTHS